MRKLLLIGTAGLALSVGAFAYASQSVLAPRPSTFKTLQLFGDVLDVVEKNYVVKVDDKKLIQAALDGMLSSLDPHSNYLDDKALKELEDVSDGTYGGLGIEVQGEDGAVKVVTPMDDSPASRAGLQSGDFITAIDGNSILGLKLNEAVTKMKGQAGSAVKLTIVREGKDEPFDVSLTREVIKAKSVKARLDGDYGIIRLSGFNRNTGEETKAAVRDLLKQNPKLKGFVLDLRNNPGGLLDASVQVADVFLTGGEVVSQRGRDGKAINRYTAGPGDEAKGLPIVVLVNNGTASAAEIVAGALKDHKRASIVGLTTFGKGSVQTVFKLNDGKDGAVKITTARYYTPSGQSIQKTGIIPDIEVAQSKEQAKLIASSTFQYSEAAYQNALDGDEGKARRGAHEVSEIPPEGFDTKKGDFQLVRAEDVLAVKGDVQLAIKNRRGIAVAAADLLPNPASRFDRKSKTDAAKAKSSEAKATDPKTSEAKPSEATPKPQDSGAKPGGK